MHELMPAFSHAVAGSLTDGAVIMPSCPYAFPAMAAATRGHGCWFDAQNVEVDLKASMLPRRRSIGRRLVRRIREVERDCCQDAEVILTVTAEDGKRLRELYGLPAERFRTVPNGVDAAAIRFQPPAERRALRERLRLHRPLALFIGSWHEPNLRAARRILRLAAGMPDVRFGIAGSVGMPLAGVELPSNVELFGVVSDELKQALLAVASVALNPMLEGSGTNIKMLDYLAAGVPVVSTEVGVRGLELDDEAGVRIVPIRAFAAAIRAVIDEPQEMAEARAREGRRQIEERFDWPVIARGIVAGARIPDVAQPAASSVATTA
jgi:glycosyltransferase involved in cell wall biosynthesis